MPRSHDNVYMSFWPSIFYYNINDNYIYIYLYIYMTFDLIFTIRRTKILPGISDIRYLCKFNPVQIKSLPLSAKLLVLYSACNEMFTKQSTSFYSSRPSDPYISKLGLYGAKLLFEQILAFAGWNLGEKFPRTILLPILFKTIHWKFVHFSRPRCFDYREPASA